MKRRNGSLTAHGREWPLYERREGALLVLSMLPEDQSEKNALDDQASREYRKYRYKPR